MVCAAGRAIPFTLLERELRIDIPTAAAALAGWRKAVDFHNLCAAVGCRPLENLNKLTERNIVDFASSEFLHPRKI